MPDIYPSHEYLLKRAEAAEAEVAAMRKYVLSSERALAAIAAIYDAFEALKGAPGA